MALLLEARGKINWSLNILRRRPDGYHELDMLLQTIDLSDTLRLEPAEDLELTIGGQGLSAGPDNLVLRAARALNEAAGTRFGARMRLEKRIPARAGLGGGSADCAAALRGLDRLWSLGFSEERLAAVGLSLGADVPYCLAGGLVRVRGIGERLDPVPGAPSVPLALCRVGEGLSTGSVFGAWDADGCAPGQSDTAALAEAVKAGRWEAAQALSVNALEAPALRMMPEIGAMLERLRALGARYVRMTGSGSTVYGVFDTGGAARRAAEALPGGFACRTVPGAGAVSFL